MYIAANYTFESCTPIPSHDTHKPTQTNTQTTAAHTPTIPPAAIITALSIFNCLNLSNNSCTRLSSASVSLPPASRCGPLRSANWLGCPLPSTDSSALIALPALLPLPCCCRALAALRVPPTFSFSSISSKLAAGTIHTDVIGAMLIVNAAAARYALTLLPFAASFSSCSKVR